MIVAVVIVGMVSSCTSASFTDAESRTDNSPTLGPADISVDGGNITATTRSVTNPMPGDSGWEFEGGVGNLGSRGYIDMDQSGDWSDGDIALECYGDTYYLPITIQQP